MSSLPSQSSVDDLLANVQKEAAQINQAIADVEPTTAAAPENAASTVSSNDIPGDMEAPVQAGESGLAGEFAPPPTVGGSIAPQLDDCRRLLAIEMPVIVQLGQRRMTVGEVMRLAVGAIIEFNKSAEDELELLANNKSIGKGHAVKVGENFGIKISRMGSLRETIQKLGGN
jgi:flagellar motor switch protein FliN/FliY